MASMKNIRHYKQHFVPWIVIEDLCWRFIFNLPPEEKSTLLHICFYIEQAHWFYLDFYCKNNSNWLYPCGYRVFAGYIFQHIPLLRNHLYRLDAVIDYWYEYKKTIPTYGAIILNRDLTQVLLVQSYQCKTSWSFPKGKVYRNENPWQCAIREVLEETGFNITNLINRNDYIEIIRHNKIVRLYIIPNIPLDTKFQPLTRYEIRACKWFPLANLPINKRDMTPKVKMGLNPNTFFLAMPFVNQIRCWVAERRFH